MCVCVRVSTPTGPLPVVVVHVQLIPVLPFVVPGFLPVSLSISVLQPFSAK